MTRWCKLMVVVIWALWPAALSTSLPYRDLAPAIPGLDIPTEPLAIVVNRSNPVDNLSASELRAVFLGTRTHWPNGRRVTLVMRDTDDSEREVILREVCGMNEQQFRTHFVRGLYSGEILSTPKNLSSVFGVRRFIFNVPGAIGYLRLSEVDSTVKTLRIDEHSPTDKGYRLRAPLEARN
jgi:ABC-type phosphate transport system substrate-binding protein